MPDLASHPPPPPKPAETVIGGRYKTLRVVGRGGMGTVYEAVHTWTGRRVALKVLLPHIASDDLAVARFRREARAGVQGAHPNIVEVLDMGVDPDDGTLFLAQEFLVGEDLAAKLTRERVLSLPEAYEVLIPAMAALHAAHLAGVVHRDVKPANLFLSQSSGATVAKVIDFGIAALADAEAVTRTGAPLGTPHYMAPEQARAARDLDARADVWSMGAVWFEALSGRRAVDGSNYHEVIFRLLTVAPPALRTLAPELPVGVCAAIDGALQPDRARRHASMAAFAHALLSDSEVAREPWLVALADHHPFPSAPDPAPEAPEALSSASPATLDLTPPVRFTTAPQEPSVASPTISRVALPIDRLPRWPLGLLALALIALALGRPNASAPPRQAPPLPAPAPAAPAPAAPAPAAPAPTPAPQGLPARGEAPGSTSVIAAPAAPRRPLHPRLSAPSRDAGVTPPTVTPDINGAPVLEP